MSSASLHIFCCPHELKNWIETLCVEKRLVAISFYRSKEFGVVFDSIDNFALQDDLHRMFLFPKSDIPQKQLKMNDVKARKWGWVDIRPGGIKEEGADKVLLLTVRQAGRLGRGTTPNTSTERLIIGAIFDLRFLIYDLRLVIQNPKS